MTGKSLWQQIKDVVTCDQKKVVINNDIRTITQAIDAERIALTNHEKNSELLKKTLFETQKKVNLLELTAKELKNTEERKRKQFDNAREQKEYKALEREIDILNKQRMGLDEDIVKQWYEVDRLKEQVDELETNKEELQNRLKHDIKVKEENLGHLTAKQEQLEQERAQCLAQLPAEWIGKYQRMQESVPDPIIPVVDGNCSACYYSILRQDIVKLKAGEVLVCRSCYRFLYFDTAEENQAHEASY